MDLAKFEILPFDTDLFGYNVAKITDTNLDLQSLESVLNQLSQDSVKLAYWYLDPENKTSNEAAEKLNGFLADQKITYGLEFTKDDYDSDPNIKSYLGKELNEKLISLVLQSGAYSRFKVSPGFNNQEFEKLYKSWITSALKPTDEKKDVLVYIEQDLLVGFITIEIKDDTLDIGLLAVNENYRGKSIGSKLVNQSFSKGLSWGVKRASVSTQADNSVACKFYEKLGFVIKKRQNIYHFWI